MVNSLIIFFLKTNDSFRFKTTFPPLCNGSSLGPMLNRGAPGRPTAPVDGPNGPVTQRAHVAHPNMVEYVFENFTKVRTIPSLRKDCLHGR